MPANPSNVGTRISFPLTLHFRGEHVPSFKNSKLLSRGKILTKPEYQRVMKRIIRSLESELRSAILTKDEGMPMGEYQRYSTVWLERLVGFDDSRQWIPEGCWTCVEVPKGEEGFDLTLELL